MELQIFNNPEFGDVRVVMKDGKPYFVAADVCRVLELTNPTVALERIDDDEKAKFSLGLPGGDTNVVNESGLYALTLTSRKPNAKKFRKWLTGEVVPSIFRTGSYSIVQPQSVLLKAASEIDPLSEILQNTFAVKRGIALSQAIDLVGSNYNLNFNSLKQLLPPAEHETGYLNPTQIGERLGGLPAKHVNKLLAEAGFQYREGKDWRLTEAGKAYGEEMPYTRNGHSGYQILWNESVIDVLNAD